MLNSDYDYVFGTIWGGLKVDEVGNAKKEDEEDDDDLDEDKEDDEEEDEEEDVEEEVI